MLTKEKIKELKSQATALKSFTSIGKNGLTENSIMQIKTYIKANNLCKIKILRSYLDEMGLDKKAFALEIAEKTDSELVQLIGLSVILYKR